MKRLDYYIMIQQDTGAAKSAGGEHVESWAQYKNCWANRKTTGGGETNENDERVSTIDVAWTVRYDASITEKMRVLYGGQTYNITYIEEFGRRTYLILHSFKQDNQ